MSDPMDDKNRLRENLRVLSFKHAIRLLNMFDLLNIEHFSRSANKLADALGKLVAYLTLGQMRPCLYRFLIVE